MRVLTKLIKTKGYYFILGIAFVFVGFAVLSQDVYAGCSCGGSSYCNIGGSCQACVADASCPEGHSCCTGSGGATSSGGCHCNTGGGPPPPPPPPAPTCNGNVTVDPAIVAGGQGLYVNAYAYGVTNASAVKFPTWTLENGQDDLVWHSGENLGGGTWRMQIPVDSHAGWGPVAVHVYMENSGHGPTWCGGSEFQKRHSPTAQVDAYVLWFSTQDLWTAFSDTTQFNPRAYDGDSDLNRVEVYKRCVSGRCGLIHANRNWNRIFDTGVMSNRNGYNSWFSHSWGDGNNIGEWEVVINAYDANGLRCSGNPTPSYPVDGWTDCDTTGLDIVRVTVANQPPRGWVYINGEENETRTVTVNQLDTVQLNLEASDQNSDLLYIDVWRKCTGGYCYSNGPVSNRNWNNVHRIFVPGGSRRRYETNYSWASLPAEDVGNWQYMIAVYDQNGMACSGDTEFHPAFLPPGSDFYDCDWFNQYDVININVEAAHSITGRVFDTDGDCSENPVTRSIPGVGGTVSITNGDFPSSDAVDASGYYEMLGFPNNYGFDGICFNGNVPSGDADWRYELACAQDSLSLGFTATNDCLWAASRVSLTSPLDLDFGYRKVSTMDTGWFTSISGSIFGGGDIYRTVPTNPLGFTGELMDGAGIARFALAGGDIDVATGGGEERVGGEGYMESMGGGISFLPLGFNVEPPVDAISTSSLSNLDPAYAYRMDSSTFDNLISDSVVDCNSAIIADGVVVLYVVDDGATITFDRDFCNNINNRRILVITDAAVVIDRGFGTPLPTPAGSPNLGLSLLTTGSILFEGTSDAVSDPDLGIVVEGGLATLGGIRFGRDLGLNNVYPAEVVRYAPQVLYDLTQQAHQDPTFSGMGLFQTTIEWDLEED